MKAGDKVTVTDGSWSKEVVDGELVDECGVSLKKRRWTVVETECSFPLDDRDHPPEYRNDTVIQADDGRVVFIHSRFLEPAEPPHVWKRGDVFKSVGNIMVYWEQAQKPRVSYVDYGYTVGDLVEAEVYLAKATFLFNIKDKLGDSWC